MTTIEDIANQLNQFVDDHELAREWLHNDIVKMKIAISYEAWVDDHPNDHPDEYGGLEGHVEYCLIHPELIIGKTKEPSE